MSPFRPAIVCERVRAQVSLRLDDDLSQLESRMVDAHLARCAGCRIYAEEVVHVTHLLRTAPCEPLERPVIVRRARRASLARMQVGASAAAVAVAVFALNGLLSGTDLNGPGGVGAPDRFGTTAQLEREIEQIIADGRDFKELSGHGAIPI